MAVVVGERSYLQVWLESAFKQHHPHTTSQISFNGWRDKYISGDAATERETTWWIVVSIYPIKQMMDIHTIWINLKCILPPKRRQPQRATYYMIPYVWQSSKIRTGGMRNRAEIARDQRLRFNCFTTKIQNKGLGMGWWNCSVSWLLRWLHDSIYLSKTHSAICQKETHEVNYRKGNKDRPVVVGQLL